jgi:hypothetical protein
VDLSLVVFIQYLCVKTVNITERWDVLPVFFSGQEQVSKVTGAWFGLKHYTILKLFQLCWYFLIAADILMCDLT